MRYTNTKQLVIDADVAQAAGSETATHPRAVNCRDFLIVVRSQNHKLVMTNKISDEWKQHQSRFARRWRLSMDARKKVDRIILPNNTRIKDKITNTTDNEDDTEAIQKDMHLLEAAMQTDKTIVSLDETIRSLFAYASRQVGEIRNIIWVNPERTTEEQPITWLKNGALPEVHRQLSAYQPVK